MKLTPMGGVTIVERDDAEPEPIAIEDEDGDVVKPPRMVLTPEEARTGTRGPDGGILPPGVTIRRTFDGAMWNGEKGEWVLP